MNKAIATPPGEPTRYEDLTADDLKLIAEDAARPPQLSLSDKLNAAFSQLPIEVQASFAPLKAAIKLELDLGNYALAKTIIQITNVPANLEATKQALLGLFDGE